MSKLKRYINKNVKPWKPCHEAHKAVVTESYECCRLLPTIPRSVTLHGLPLHGCVAVIPRGFLFAVIPLRVDCVLWRWSRREELCEPVTMTNSKIKWCDLILFSMQCMHTVKYTLVNHSIISTCLIYCRSSTCCQLPLTWTLYLWECPVMSGIRTLSVDPLILQGLLRHIPQMLDQIEIWSMEARSTPSVLYCALEPKPWQFLQGGRAHSPAGGDHYHWGVLLAQDVLSGP